MFKVIYAIDTLDPKPDVTFFATEDEAIDHVEEEIERRVSFLVEHSQYRITEDDLNSLREIERTLVHIEDWRE